MWPELKGIPKALFIIAIIAAVPGAGALAIVFHTINNSPQSIALHVWGGAAQGGLYGWIIFTGVAGMLSKRDDKRHGDAIDGVTVGVTMMSRWRKAITKALRITGWIALVPGVVGTSTVLWIIYNSPSIALRDCGRVAQAGLVVCLIFACGAEILRRRDDRRPH